MADFTIKQNDRRPVIQGTCKDADGNPVDLTGATGVTFNMKEEGAGAPKVSTAGTIVSPATGVVKYDWAAGDTDTIGSYLAEFEVTWSAGVTETFPNGGNLTIDVIDDLA